MKSKGYFWYSQKQKEKFISLTPDRAYATINGEIVEYTEMKNDSNESSFQDAVFLGTGFFHHSEWEDENGTE